MAPTLAILLLLAPSGYTCSTVCAECHSAIAARQRETRHARALRRVPETELAQFTANPLRERGGTEFTYEAAPGGLKAIASLAGERAEILLEWAFGAGAQGVTPVGRRNGKWVEHRISYYRAPARPARTVGHPAASSPDAASALGLVQDPATITRCFGCHATGVGPGPDLSAMEPGVTCERCHEPGRDHVEAARARRGPAELARTVLNAARFNAKASVEICAECHRLMPAGTLASTMPEMEDPVSVRFQPIGLAASRCFQKSGRLSCITCHDPHENAASGESSHYSAKCVSCHSASAAGRAGRTALAATCHVLHRSRT